LKTLVLSDVHYPFGVSTISYEIIKKENPDRVVLLGDLVVGKGEQVIERMKSFFENYPFSLKKSVVLIGDNEYKGDKRVVDFVKRLPVLNTNPFCYRTGNMFFCHGNIEGRGALSEYLEELGKDLGLTLKPLTPLLVSLVARIRYTIPRSVHMFLGHIHYLGKVDAMRTTFCGTFSTKKVIYDLKDSLGYVVIEHPATELINQENVTLVRINRVVAA